MILNLDLGHCSPSSIRSRRRSGCSRIRKGARAVSLAGGARKPPDGARQMLKYAFAYLATGLTFAALDAVWLTVTGPRLYRPALEPILAERFNLPAAVVFYVIYVAGVVLLAVLPTLRENAAWTRALTTGAVLGFMAYATYDLTNQATLRLWSVKVTVLDILWGTVLTAASAAAGFLAYRWSDARWG
jgi:uncharacterized membrane protein